MGLRAALIAGLATLVFAAPAQADTWTVTDGSSDAPTGCNATAQTCVSLRAAIAASEATKGVADVIDVPAGTIEIDCDLVIQSDITINGAGARTNVIDGGGKHRGFRVTAGGNAKINHFTIRNGAAGQAGSNDGGGVLNMGGRVALDHVRITTSTASRGGGVANLTGGLLALRHVLVDGNVGGGVVNVGGAESTPPTWVQILDSTIYNNSGPTGGAGGIVSTNQGVVTLLRSTVADNTGGARSTIGGLQIGATKLVSVTASILARNRNEAGSLVNCGATRPTDGGGNVEDNDTCGVDFTANPGLETKLTNGGGEIDVLALAATSPAVDRVPGGDNCPAGTLDQRRLYRPQGSACDSGAYELDQAATFTITSGPSATVTTTDVQFGFSSSEPGVNSMCQLIGPGQPGGFVACYKANAQPYSGLANGTYTFSVRDGAFPAAKPTTRTFTVAALDTTITGGPDGPTNDTTPTFAFTGVNGAVSFQCRVDSAPFAACASPFTTAALADGAHTFQVRAVDRAGNVDGSAASRTWTVDTVPPPAPEVSGPEGPTTNSSPEFRFAAAEAAATECRLDGPAGVVGAFGACTSPQSFSALAPGDYVYFVRSTDAAGNSRTTQRAFTVTVPQQATPTPTPTATPTPTPTANQTVNAQPVSGIVLVKVNGKFVPLVPSLIKNGTEIDARKGVVEITTAAGEVARFSDGVFKINQTGGLTTLTLSEKLTGCPKKKSSASAAATKPKTRKLWGDGKGRFRTKGQYSAATVRGTKWLVQDTCTTTLTRVTEGVVQVEDFAKKRKVLVKNGKRYTARAQRR